MKIDLTTTVPARSIRLESIGATRHTTNGETPRLVVTIHNSAGQYRRFFEDPPLLAEANVYKGDELVFSGIVRAVLYGAMIELEIER